MLGGKLESVFMIFNCNYNYCNYNRIGILMLANFTISLLRRRGIHYAWVIALVTFLVMLTTSAALGLPGAMLQPLSKEFGWSTDQLSSIFAVRFALYGLLGPFAAIFIARFGLRRIMVTAACFIAIGMAMAVGVTQLWQLFLLWGIVLGCGTGLTALVLGAMVTNRWFTTNRGLVIGLFAASAATGQLLFLPAAAWIIEHFGWRYAVIPVVTACLAVCFLATFFIRDYPKDVGLRPFGEPEVQQDVAAPVPLPKNLWGPFAILAEVMRNKTFIILAATFFICGLSTNGLLQTHFISLCGDNGLAAVPAASVLAMMGAFDLVGTTLSGYLSDRYDNRKLLFWYYGLRGFSLFWLPFSTFTLYGLSLFAMFYGLDWIATVPPTAKLAVQVFGKDRAGPVFGWVFAAHQLGAATAAYGAGLSRTILMTYNPALFGAAAACLLAALLVMAIRLPVKN
jgi:sugar phosphate permease